MKGTGKHRRSGGDRPGDDAPHDADRDAAPPGDATSILSPPLTGEPPDLRARRSWAHDALYALAEARGRRLEERGDSRFGEVYTLIVGVVVFTAMAGSLASGVFSRSCSGPLCAGAVEGSAYAWLALAIAVATAGALAVGARALGPAGLSAARRSWFASAPIDRALVVRGPLTTVISLLAAVGGVVGLLVALTASAGRSDLPSLLAGGAAGAAAAAFGVVLAGLVQTSRLARAWTIVGWCLLVAGILTAALAVAPWSTSAMPAVPALTSVPVVPVALGIGLLALLGAVLGWVVLRPRLRTMPLIELQRAGDTSEAVISSLLMLETTALDELRGSRALAKRGRHRSRPMRGRGWVAIASAELRRLTRSRTPIVVAVLLVAVPVLVSGLLGAVPAIIGAALVAVMLGNGSAGGLRLWTRSSSVNRMFPFAARQVRAAYLLVPALLVSGWLAVVCLLVGLGWITWAVLAVAAASAVLRAAPESSVGLAAGNVVMTPQGAIPVGLIGILMRGPDVAVIPVVLLLAGFPGAAFMLALAFLVGFLWRD